MFEPLRKGVIGRALDKGILEFEAHDLRNYGLGRYRQLDDSPYGGGPGMIMRIEPVVNCVRDIQKQHREGRAIILSAAGKPFDQKKAEKLAKLDSIIMICGRYEGIDARVADVLDAEELSIGPYVLSGGELPAMVVIDTVTRLLPGVLGNADSLQDESHMTQLDAAELEYPQYTRPEEFEGHKVPEVLLSGNHGEILKWRKSQRKKKG
jgi:tRNA (guanine37-N1)-methyltransferase